MDLLLHLITHHLSNSPTNKALLDSPFNQDGVPGLSPTWFHQGFSFENYGLQFEEGLHSDRHKEVSVNGREFSLDRVVCRPKRLTYLLDF